MRQLPASEAAPLIACVLAAGEAQDRLAAAQPRQLPPRPEVKPWVPLNLSDLSPEELTEARSIARSTTFSMGEAADIVRRSRK